MKSKYKRKVYKLSLDTGCTCPNRDGKKGYGGCSFCSQGGSGDFAEKVTSVSDLPNAISRAKKRVERKVPADAAYIAYFQSFTNTYGDEDHLLSIFEAAAAQPEIVELAIGTRPDSISNKMLDGLSNICKKTPITLELGLQTINDHTAEAFNRGYKLKDFEKIYPRLKDAGLNVVIHLIIGLPNEDLEQMKKSLAYVASLSPRPDGVKLSLLHLLKNTAMGRQFEDGQLAYGRELHYFSLEEYAKFLTELIAMLPMDMAVQRLTGDPPKSLLIEPIWTCDKKRVLNTINKSLQDAGLIQRQK